MADASRFGLNRRGLVVFPSLALAVAVSCSAVTPASSAADSTGVAQRSSPTTTVAPKGAAARPVARVLSGVRIARERPNGYKRSLFTHWTDDDRNGCSAREDVLIAESLSPAQVDPFGCKVIEGDWYSPYDGRTHTDPSNLDIDHVVALKEAWDSGAHSWSASRRRAFANDLSDPRSLIAVTDSVNRSKGDKDPSNWMPPNRADWCRYIADWVAVKVRWGLSMDQSEHGRISNLARGECSSTTVAAWGRGAEARQPAGGATTLPPTDAPVRDSVPATSPADSVPPRTEAPSGARTVRPGAFCKTTEIGQTGTSRGEVYICSRTKTDGTPYVDNRARWRKI